MKPIGERIVWTGLSLIFVSRAFQWNQAFDIAGAILMGVGVVLMWMDK